LPQRSRSSKQPSSLAAGQTAVHLETMRAIKRALDPENRTNPGKMVSS
jgi:FAD/FMN-containing dehydrogenase